MKRNISAWKPVQPGDLRCGQGELGGAIVISGCALCNLEMKLRKYFEEFN